MGKLKMDHEELVESIAASGGLLDLWRNPVVLKVIGKTKNFIDVRMGTSSDEKWRD